MAYGVIKSDDVAAMPDLNKREIALLLPIALVVLWMGVYPESFMAPMRKDVGALEARLASVKPAGDAQVKMGKAPALMPAAHAEKGHH